MTSQGLRDRPDLGDIVADQLWVGHSKIGLAGPGVRGAVLFQREMFEEVRPTQVFLHI